MQSLGSTAHYYVRKRSEKYIWQGRLYVGAGGWCWSRVLGVPKSTQIQKVEMFKIDTNDGSAPRGNPS